MSDPLQDDILRTAERIDLTIPGATFLVTGATGLVGSYIVETLVQLAHIGHHVKTIHAVSMSGNVPLWQSRDQRIRRHFGNLADPKFYETLPKADVVVHAAGYGQPGKFMANPLGTLALNVQGTIALMERVNPEGTFLFLSSSEVYSGLAGSFTEDQIGTTNTNHQRACYIEAKRAGEAAVSSQGLTILASAARLALAYGPGTQLGDSRVVNEFIAQGLTTGHIAMRDAGSAIRTYCYITDAIEMLFAIITARKPDIYNVGGNSRTSIRQLADTVATACNAVVIAPEGEQNALSGAPNEVQLDVSKVLSLGVQPRWTSLTDGISRTVRWQANNLFNKVGGTNDNFGYRL